LIQTVLIEFIIGYNCHGNILKEIVNNLEILEIIKIGLKYLLEIGTEGVIGKYRVHINKQVKN
jgi:hypothetical protein